MALLFLVLTVSLNALLSQDPPDTLYLVATPDPITGEWAVVGSMLDLDAAILKYETFLEHQLKPRPFRLYQVELGEPVKALDSEEIELLAEGEPVDDKLEENEEGDDG
jgi:hypothetical protein